MLSYFQRSVEDYVYVLTLSEDNEEVLKAIENIECTIDSIGNEELKKEFINLTELINDCNKELIQEVCKKSVWLGYAFSKFENVFKECKQLKEIEKDIV